MFTDICFIGHHLSSLLSSRSFILPTLNSILFKKSDLLNIGFHVHTLMGYNGVGVSLDF